MERRIARAAAATALNPLVVPLPQNRTLGRSVGRSEGWPFFAERRGRGERSRFDLSFVMQKSRISLELEERGGGRGRQEGRKEDAADAAAVKNEDVSDL